jgi:predicted nucleotidyltransferase component of viral defense system
VTDTPKNISASNRAKLLNLSRQSGQSFQQIVQYFAMTRFLYRLSQSELSSRFILKGAMMLHARNMAQARSTLDIDLLGRLNNSAQSVADAIRTIIAQPVDEDGLSFDSESISVSTITKDADYAGRRANFRANLDTMVIPMQIDIGFGDKVIPEPSLVETPALLDYPAGRIYGYAIETSVAEKVHAMMQLELLNSRMKDFYDIWFLMQEKQIDKGLLVDAIVGTFMSRQLGVDMDSAVFSDEFIHHPDKQSQWSAFCRKKVIKSAPSEFSLVATDVFTFLKPIMQTARERILGGSERESE